MKDGQQNFKATGATLVIGMNLKIRLYCSFSKIKIPRSVAYIGLLKKVASPGPLHISLTSSTCVGKRVGCHLQVQPKCQAGDRKP